MNPTTISGSDIDDLDEKTTRALRDLKIVDNDDDSIPPLEPANVNEGSISSGQEEGCENCTTANEVKTPFNEYDNYPFPHCHFQPLPVLDWPEMPSYEISSSDLNVQEMDEKNARFMQEVRKNEDEYGYSSKEEELLAFNRYRFVPLYDENGMYIFELEPLEQRSPDEIPICVTELLLTQVYEPNKFQSSPNKDEHERMEE